MNRLIQIGIRESNKSPDFFFFLILFFFFLFFSSAMMTSSFLSSPSSLHISTSPRDYLFSDVFINCWISISRRTRRNRIARKKNSTLTRQKKKKTLRIVSVLLPGLHFENCFGCYIIARFHLNYNRQILIYPINLLIY